jgi:hypothetical protein
MVCKGVPATPYTVQVTDTQANITIQNGKPFVVSLRADGKLAGTGQVRVTGQVPAGTRTEQTTGNSTQTATRTRELTPLEAGQYPNAKQNGQTFTIQDDASKFVNGPSSRTVIDFVTKTDDRLGRTVAHRSQSFVAGQERRRHPHDHRGGLGCADDGRRSECRDEGDARSQRG